MSTQDGNVFTFTPTLDTSAYVDNDVLFNPVEIDRFFLDPGGISYLMSIHVLDKSDQGQPFDLVFLDTNTNLGTLNAVVDITDANAEGILWRQSIGSGDYYDLVASRIASVVVPAVPLKAAATSQKLYVAGISRGTGTYAAAGLVIKIGKANGAL